MRKLIFRRQTLLSSAAAGLLGLLLAVGLQARSDGLPLGGGIQANQGNPIQPGSPEPQPDLEPDPEPDPEPDDTPTREKDDDRDDDGTPAPTATPRPVCGNNACEPGEGSYNCAIDCPGTCGDAICAAAELDTCPADCPPSLTCGDGLCSAGEDYLNCRADCPVSLVCGDGVCTIYEDGQSCPADCGRVAPIATQAAPAQAGSGPGAAPTLTPSPAPSATAQPTRTPAAVAPVEAQAACFIVPQEQIAADVRGALTGLVGVSDALLWVICEAPPQQISMPVAFDEPPEEAAALRLYDCTIDGCGAYGIDMLTEAEAVYVRNGSAQAAQCLSGCALVLRSAEPAPQAPTPGGLPGWLLWVVLLILGLLVLIAVLLLVRRRRPDGDDDGGDEVTLTNQRTVL